MYPSTSYVFLDDQEKLSVPSSVKAKEIAKQSPNNPTKGLIWPAIYPFLVKNEEFVCVTV